MTLRVMTYNIHHGLGTDGRVDLGRIAEVIRSFQPDIVGLQELDIRRARSGAIDQPSELGLRLGLSATFAPCITDGNGEQYGIATLTRLSIVDSRTIMLPRQPERWRSEQRCALVTRLAWNGGHIAVVNTHLSTLSRERPAQIAALACELGCDETIVLGDFNCTPRARPFRQLCNELRNATAGARSWPARLPLVPIDHILVRGPLEVVRAGTWRPAGARHASDHLPVIAELDYPQAA